MQHRFGFTGTTSDGSGPVQVYTQTYTLVIHLNGCGTNWAALIHVGSSTILKTHGEVFESVVLSFFSLVVLRVRARLPVLGRDP